jgi:hypothetical protein
VKLTFQGETKVLKISEGTSVLEAAEKVGSSTDTQAPVQKEHRPRAALFLFL